MAKWLNSYMVEFIMFDRVLFLQLNERAKIKDFPNLKTLTI